MLTLSTGGFDVRGGRTFSFVQHFLVVVYLLWLLNP